MGRQAKHSTTVLSLWIEALRSGDYEQTPGCLRIYNTNHCCCLGVLCEVMGYPKSKSPHRATYIYEFPDRHISSRNVGSKVIQEVFPLLVENLACEVEAQLISMNDRGQSFSEIADFLERVDAALQNLRETVEK